jgi:hypothetical protein
MKLSTQNELQHHHTIINADRASLNELLDLVKADKTTGKLVVSYNQGGITSVTFEEKKRVTQNDLDEWDAMRHPESSNGNGAGHLSTRGEIHAVSENA